MTDVASGVTTGLAPFTGPLGLAGAAISGIGAITGGLSTAAQARYQAQVNENNAIVAAQNAAYAGAAGSQQATAESYKSAARGGAIKTQQAAAGIDVNTGSAVNVQASERQTGQLSALTAENNALLQAYGYRTAATGYTAEAGLQRAEAAQAPIGAALAAGGGLLGNASAIGYKFNAGTAGVGSNLASPGSSGAGGLY